MADEKTVRKHRGFQDAAASNARQTRTGKQRGKAKRVYPKTHCEAFKRETIPKIRQPSFIRKLTQ